MTDSTSDGYWPLIEDAFNAVSIYDGPDEFLRGVNQYPEHVRLLLAAHWFSSEFCNGGLHQFFYNPTGVLAPEAVEGLRALGLSDAARSLQNAMDRVGTPYPRDRDARFNIVGEDPASGMNFDDLDEQVSAAFGEPIKDADDNWTDDFGRAANAYAGRYKK